MRLRPLRRAGCSIVSEKWGGLHPAACATGALTLAFAPSFWAEANIQRVDALGALFVALAMILAYRWYQDRGFRTLGLAFFVCALGATNHTFMLVYAVALGIVALATEPRQVMHPRRLAALGVTFAAGLVPYAYLPLRSRQNPRLDWGNPETLDAFLGVVLRRDFWERAWVESGADAMTVLGDYLGSFVAEVTWLGVALAVVGIVVGRRRWPLALLLAVMAGNVAALALHGSRADIFFWHRYYIPSYIMAALFVAAGADRLIGLVPLSARWHRLRALEEGHRPSPLS